MTAAGSAVSGERLWSDLMAMAEVGATPEGGSPKFTRFHEALRRHGATRPLPDPFDRLETWSYAPLTSSDAIAAEIARRWVKRRQMLGTPQPARVGGA